jgi:hypothetical protein
MLFEIHITLHPDDYILLKQVCLDDGFGYILVKNEYGKNAWQLIVTKWVNRDGRDEAIARAKELAEYLKSKGLTVVRTKVEYELSNIQSIEYSLHPGEYFEFHIKIPIKQSTQYNLVKTLGIPHNVVWSTLVQSKSNDFMPISTLRIKHGTMTNAVECKSKWIEELNRNGISLSSKMHQELCIYDDNVDYDEGWDGK